MTYKIHYSIDNYNDNFIASGENVEEIKTIVHNFFESRGINEEKCNFWSELVKEQK